MLFVLALPAWPVDKERTIFLEICHGFGCREQTTIKINSREWASVTALFPARTAQEERRQIKYALGYMEYLAGLYSPLGRDLGGNAQPAPESGNKDTGQLDCIDEAVNTTRFLKLFEHMGLLRYHRVLRPAYRRSLLVQHWAGHVEEVTCGDRFVYDSWFEDNGQPSILVSSQSWHDLNHRPSRRALRPNRLHPSRFEGLHQNR